MYYTYRKDEKSIKRKGSSAERHVSSQKKTSTKKQNGMIDRQRKYAYDKLGQKSVIQESRISARRNAFLIIYNYAMKNRKG